MKADPMKCTGNIDDPNCDHHPVWQRATGTTLTHYFCDMHARRETNFDETNRALWTRLDEGFNHASAIVGSPQSKKDLQELRKAFKPVDFRNNILTPVERPVSVKDYIDKARAAGHDALGIANDPEAIATLEAVKARRSALPPTEATIVEGEIAPAALYGGSSPFSADDDVVYRIKLIRKEPGNVELLLTINGRICGQMPFDNLIKASVRIDPDHASGPEKQIQKLRKEAAEAKAAMYDWQARTMQLEERLKQYEAAEAVVTEVLPPNPNRRTDVHVNDTDKEIRVVDPKSNGD